MGSGLTAINHGAPTRVACEMELQLLRQTTILSGLTH
jgi:hypothetical protein